MTEEYILSVWRNTDHRDEEGEWIYEMETYEFSTFDEAFDYAAEYTTLSSVKNEFTIEGDGAFTIHS